MKAHHGGPELVEHVGNLGAEGRPPTPLGDRAHVETELLVIGRERRSPGCLALGARARRRVAKEVDVERLDRLRPDRRQFLAQGIRAEQGARKRAQSPGVGHGHRQRALPWTPAIGA